MRCTLAVYREARTPATAFASTCSCYAPKVPRPAPGELAPDFEALDVDGRTVRLSDFLGTRTVVLYFYPKDETPGCTQEARTFRDAHEEFLDAGALVIGVSRDSPSSHKSFRERHGLPFVLLSDSNGSAAAAFGVTPTLGIIPGRVTFVIEPSGKICHVYDSQLMVRRHVREALAKVRTLQT